MASQEEENGHFNDYLVLHPNEAGFLDLGRIFCSSELNKRDFFDAPAEYQLTGIRRRWLIFVSIVAQKTFLRLKEPIGTLGSTVEKWMNYPTFNGGYARLLFNFLRGNVVSPNSSSATFRSLIGCLDPRVDLDANINIDDDQYRPALAVMAAKICYENEAFVSSVVEDHWKMKFLEIFNFWNVYEEKCTTQAIMFQDKSVDPNLIVVAFRGTSPFDLDDWITDLDLSWYDIKSVGRLHAGFQKALGLQKDNGWPKEIDQESSPNQFAYYTIRERLRNILIQNKKAKFMVCGHSLGGALAILFTSILSLHEEKLLLDRMEGVYTFGQPRVGDEKFGEFMKEKLRVHDVKYWRFVYCNDVVPRLPYDDKTLMFKHFGPCLYFNSLYRGQILEEEPNRNYFSLLWVLPKILNAAFELMRSCVIPFIYGVEYTDGLAELVFRIIGLLIPGLSNHGPRDYVNVTRLGSLPKLAKEQSMKED